MKQIFSILFTVYRSLAICSVVAFALAGCGGSGGGGGGDDGLKYKGSKSPAAITQANASRLAANALGVQSLIDTSTDAVSRPGAATVPNSDTARLLRISTTMSLELRKYFLSAMNSASRSIEVRARTEIDDSESCDFGSFDLDGYINNDGTGRLAVDYKNCIFGDVELDGKVILRIYVFDFGFFIPTNSKFTLEKLKVTSPDIDVVMEGELRSRIEIDDDTEFTEVPTLIIKNRSSGEMLMVKNQSSAAVFDNIFFPSSLSLEIFRARIYDSEIGYVDARTLRPLEFSDLSQEFPDAGIMLVLGSSGRSILVRTISDNLVLLELDLDSDHTVELAARLDWEDLIDEKDLTDDDGDGVYDAWELIYGLDPNDPADAGLDPDGDTFTNSEEQLGGTNPNLPASFPTSANLAVTTVPLSAALAGADYDYRLDISNAGPQTAFDLLVVNTLPPGAVFIDAFGSGSGWRCTYVSSTVYCSLDSLALSTRSVTIEVRLPATPGTITNRARASATTVDTDFGDNSDSFDIDVM